MKTFKIGLLSIKEKFLDALNTSDMHSNNLNFVSSRREWFFRSRNIDFFPEREDHSLLEVTAETGLWYGLIMYFKSSFV